MVKTKLKQGQVITVFNVTPSGMPRIEGRATLVKFIAKHPDNFEQWEVQFPGETETYIRFIDTTQDR